MKNSISDRQFPKNSIDNLGKTPLFQQLSKISIDDQQFLKNVIGDLGKTPLFRRPPDLNYTENEMRYK